MAIIPVYQNKAGPRKKASTEPLPLDMLPAKRDYKRVIAFFNEYITLPDGTPFQPRPFQREILRGLFPSTVNRRPSMGLLSIPRGQGKSFLGAAIGLWALVDPDTPSPEILLTSATQEVAMRQIFRVVASMIARDPRLSERCQVSRDTIQVPSNGGALYALASTEQALQGFGATLVVCDELHVTDEVVWQSLVSGKKRDPSLVLAVSTPPSNPLSVMKKLALDAREKPDPDFFFKEFTADPTADPLDPEVIKAARPLTGGSAKQVKSLTSMMAKIGKPTFQRLMLGCWDVAEDSAWLTPLDVDAITTPAGRRLVPGERVVLAVDGSYNNDTSAIVACTVEKVPHIEIVKLWEPSGDGETIPIADIEDTISRACETYSVEEVCFDPWRFSRSMEALEAKKLPIAAFPQSASRMVPATQSIRAAIADKTLSIASDPVLRQHLLNCRVRDSDRGQTLTKVTKDSPLKVDAAVCAVMAYSRAMHYASKVKTTARVARFKFR